MQTFMNLDSIRKFITMDTFFFFFFLQISDYEKEIEIMQTVTKKEYLATLRRYDS